MRFIWWIVIIIIGFSIGYSMIMNSMMRNSMYRQEMYNQMLYDDMLYDQILKDELRRDQLRYDIYGHDHYEYDIRRSNQDCICSYNAYDCDDFSTQAKAQSCFIKCGVNNDIHHLDRDLDGRVCELNE